MLRNPAKLLTVKLSKFILNRISAYEHRLREKVFREVSKMQAGSLTEKRAFETASVDEFSWALFQ